MFWQKRGVALLILRCHISGKIYSTSEIKLQFEESGKEGGRESNEGGG